jgi:hypothetical protein
VFEILDELFVITNRYGMGTVGVVTKKK